MHSRVPQHREPSGIRRLNPGAAALRPANPMENPTFCREWEREGELE